MREIVKRLELIKTAISIEDEEIIDLQIMKLKNIDCDENVKSILIQLKNKNYGLVAIDIDNYLNQQGSITIYEDKELQGLRLELKSLEQSLQHLTAQRDEYLNDINEFNIQYHTLLGAIIQKILNLKKELLEMALKVKKDILERLNEEYQYIKKEYQKLKSIIEIKEQELESLDEFDDTYDVLYEELQELRQLFSKKEQEVNEKRKEAKQAKKEYSEDELSKEYEDIKKDSEDFSTEYEQVRSEKRVELNDDEKQELKKLFRKASKLCHPDIVSDELKEQAHEIMQSLNEAYSQHDLLKIKEILFSLENGRGFDVASDVIEDKELLREKIKEIREMLANCNIEVNDIKNNEVIQILEDYKDLDEYFSRLKKELDKEYERLKHTDDKKSEPVSNDSYWSDEF